MNKIDLNLVARRVSRPAFVLMSLLAIHLILWILAVIFSVFIWFPRSKIMLFPAFPEVIGVLLELALIGALFFLRKEVRRASRLALLINILLISFVYLGVAALIGYGASGLPSLYQSQMELGAKSAWLFSLVAILGLLATFFILLIVRKWGFHVGATKMLFSTTTKS